MQCILTYASVDKAGYQSQQDKTTLPVVVPGHSRDSQVHEDDGFTDRGQHLHEVLDGGVRLLRDVLLHILLHGDPTKHTPKDSFEK